MEKTKQPSLDQDGLSLREKLFCYLYIGKKGNGAQAAREAGYSGDCGQRATQLLSRPQVKAVIERERARLMRKAEINAERVICELARIAFFHPSQLFFPDKTLIHPSQLDEDTAAAISGIRWRKGELFPEVRWSHKIQALELLGRWLGMWEGQGAKHSNRLSEVLEAFKAGPVDTTKLIQ